jgi:hypothetical protein
MRVAIFTSVSANIKSLAAQTLGNKFAYCMRHGCSLILDNRPYEEAVAGTADLVQLLNVYDMVWTLDADAVITDMRQRIEDVPHLGPHMTVCEEGIVPWNRLNCGSVVWKNTPQTKAMLLDIAATRDQWILMPCVWQTWIEHNLQRLGDTVTVAPLRAFNSTVWNRPGNGPGKPGSHWQAGDFVYHPCGVFPMVQRQAHLAAALEQVIE